MFSAAAKAGIVAGDTIVTINDWNVEAMDNIQVYYFRFGANRQKMVLYGFIRFYGMCKKSKSKGNWVEWVHLH